MSKVVLKTAYYWICEECGRDNYDRPVLAEIVPGDKETVFREWFGLEEFEELPDDWENFQLVAIPRNVTCEHCGQEYETEDDRIES